MSISKIVITGGPCGGKSTAMSWIQNAFTELGYQVIFIAETATELITAGVTHSTCNSSLDFQKAVLKMQLNKEAVFEEAARTMKKERVLIVCDRGTIDGKAYMTDEQFNGMLSNLNMNEVELRDTYDGIFHLVTAAKGAEEYYTTTNNTARTETPEQARELDDKIISAWTGHPHFRVIDNSTGFDLKMKRLISEIRTFLGEPTYYEIERRFLIEYPDVAWLESLPNARKVEIIQTYLKSENPDEEVRIRQRGTSGNYIYYQTTKCKAKDQNCVETERRLTKDEYLELLMQADTSLRQVRKTRYLLTYGDDYFEIDLFPFWNDKAIVEIDLSSENEEIEFPPQLKIIKEISGDDAYRNKSLAQIKGE